MAERSDERRPDEPRPDERRPDERRPDERRPDERRPDERRPDEPRPDEPRPDEPRPGTLSEADRRRLEAVFGDVLPSTTSDERGPDAVTRDPDADLLADRPPHHDRGG